MQGDFGYSREAVQAVLDSPIPYTREGGQAEIDLTEKLFQSLTEDQIEQAAQASYAYWAATALGHHPPTMEQRNRMAKRECRRHLMKKTYQEASSDILETFQYRKERRIDLMRACFLLGAEKKANDLPKQNANCNHPLSKLGTEDQKILQHYRTLIEEDLSHRQKGYIYGHDKEGRAVLIVRSRVREAQEDEAFILALLYLMERAIACTESFTLGAQEKIMVVLDFADFSSSLSPSLAAVKQVVKTLQHRYTERLYKMVIIDPPFWMRTTYMLVKPFLDPITTAKFILAAGDKAKHTALTDLVEADQAMPFMLPEGKLDEHVNVQRYLYETPFQMGYGEEVVTLSSS